MSSKEKIDDWFTKPIDFLDKNYHKDSGFVVLLASFCLAERLVKAVCRASGEHEKNDFQKYLISVLGVDPAIAPIFWNMFRDGTMHYATPFSGKVRDGGGFIWGWHLDDSYTNLPVVQGVDATSKLIQLNPWGWFHHVISKYSEYPEVHRIDDTRKLGVVGSSLSYPQQPSVENPPFPTLPNIAPTGTGILVQYNPPQ